MATAIITSSALGQPPLIGRQLARAAIAAIPVFCSSLRAPRAWMIRFIFLERIAGEPGWFMKLMILGAQGVYFNTMFFWYLVHPRVGHRFVSYLEEEAMHTYLLLYIRADEASHRGVNHTLGNLDQKADPNPFVSVYKAGGEVPKPLARPQGYERHEFM